jgi:hypothetical protein
MAGDFLDWEGCFLKRQIWSLGLDPLTQPEPWRQPISTAE